MTLAPQEQMRREFAALYAANYSRVVSVCSRHLRDARDVEEAVQDTFVKAYLALPRFGGERRLWPWLRRIARNSSIDLARRNMRRLEVPLVHGADLVPEPAAEEMADVSSDVSDALAKVSPIHARALRLSVVYGASYRDVGAILGRSPAQTKSILHRARRSARRAMTSAHERFGYQ